MTQNIIAGVKVTQATTLTAGAAGVSAIKSSNIDMSDYETVLFVVPFGTITSGAVTSIKAQQSVDTTDGNFADLVGSSVTVVDTADDTCFYVEVTKPQKRYVRLYITRGTQNAIVGTVLAIQANGRVKPPVQDTTITSGKLLVGVDEGTA
jgi:hypothetical protein